MIFLEIYGDIEMYLSVFKEDRNFWIDIKNCLLRKKELGGVGTPIFQILQQLSCSSMFEHFAGYRIAELKISLYFSRQISMFALCANNL